MRTLLVIGFCWVIGAALTVHARREPEPRPLSAPTQVFSQARARRIQQLVAGDARPRPVGSTADLAAVQRISSELALLGMAPTLQQSLACSEGRCGNITNLLARIDGTEAGCVLLVAHHDSVEASPGASDDGAGIAVLLETARALRAGPTLRHGVILLIDDGEEVGSLGAAAFVAEHPWMRDVAAVINVDNGGTSGLSLLYGTGAGNLGVVDVYARAVQQPASSSILALGHALLSRTSDFTVFARRGLPGLDLAFAAGETRYHTSRDTVERSHPGSVQHEGDSVLALTRALAASDLTHLVTKEAVWFDLFGRWVVRWPAAWSLWFAFLAFAWLALAAWRTGVQPVAWTRAMAAAFLATAASAGLAFAVQQLLTYFGVIPADYVREPSWLMVSMLALGLLCVAAISSRLARFDPAALELGVWCAWCLCTFVTALALPGANVLFMPVTLIAAAARALLAHSRGAATLTQAAAALALAAVWFPGLALAPETFGLSALVVFAAPAAWIASLLLPGLAALRVRQRRLFILLTSGVVAFGLCGHAFARKFDEDSPQRVNVVAYTDTTTGRSVAIVDTAWGGARTAAPAAMSAELARLAGQVPRYAPPYAWRSTPVLFAPFSELSPPTETVSVQASAAESALATTLRVQLTPAVRRLVVLAQDSAPIAELRIGARRWPSHLRTGRVGTRARLRVWELYAPARNTVLRLQWVSAQHAPTELTFVADTPDLPGPLRALVDARPPWAAASQAGDHSVFSMRLRL